MQTFRARPIMSINRRLAAGAILLTFAVLSCGTDSPERSGSATGGRTSALDLSQLPDSFYSPQSVEMLRTYMPSAVAETLLGRGVPPDAYNRFMHAGGVNFLDPQATPTHHFLYYSNGINHAEVLVLHDKDGEFVPMIRFESMLPGQWTSINTQDFTGDGQPEVVATCWGGRRRLSVFNIFELVNDRIKMITPSPQRVHITKRVVGKKVEYRQVDADSALEIRVQTEIDAKPGESPAWVVNTFDFDTAWHMYELIQSDTATVIRPGQARTTPAWDTAGRRSVPVIDPTKVRPAPAPDDSRLKPDSLRPR